MKYMKYIKKKKAIMNLESLEARTLFAGADDVFVSEDINNMEMSDALNDALLDLEIVDNEHFKAFG
ncbi:MAG TPA: hypothetical protein DIU37_02065 [Opitutae bacterium]|nr:hypothetical protein [Opitutae bacterium]